MTNQPLKCRYCKTELVHTFVNLGMSPLSNNFLSEENKSEMERFFPLHVFVCHHCFLVQLPVYEDPQHIFQDYAYFSSYSESWLNHTQQYADMIIERQRLNEKSFVVEIASNDGYLLQNFVKKGINALGIEPAKNIAQIAKEKGVATDSAFFDVTYAKKMLKENKQADLIIVNNVLAHIPDINNFVQGIHLILKEDGIATFEFPSVLNLVKSNQFDTIYHEHFSYLSLHVVDKLFISYGLKIFDTEELLTHGGSLRVYACKDNNTKIHRSVHVSQILEKESLCGVNDLNMYLQFSDVVKRTKRKILRTLIDIKQQNKTIIGYGAPAKGNTLLNYCGIRDDFLNYTVDINPYKQSKFLPGTHLPIFHPQKINDDKPDYIFILPWNLRDEIMTQLSYVKNWGCKFIVPIPDVEIIS
jgi:SAM-dependent methyltransferase